MERLKNFSYILYILSLIPGDTFYGDLHMAQSFFLIPVLFLYFLQRKYSFNRQIIIPILIVLGVATIYLLINPLGSIIEWYRIIGNIFLVIMIPDMFKSKSRAFIIIPIILIGAIPAIAFYLGFWEFKFEFQLRMSFLRHDPNILSYNLLFSYIFALYFLKLENFKWVSKYAIVFIVTGFYAVPILATLSRTALASLILIFVLYVFLAESRKSYKIVTLFIALGVISVGIMQLANNELISALSERVNEGDKARTDFLASSIKVLKNNFFTGVGLANFGDNQWRIANGFFRSEDGQIVQTASHNGMLDIIMIGGIFFFLAIIMLLLYPALKVYNRKGFFRKSEYCLDRFLTFSVFIIFIVINLTYSSYMSKTAWTSVALLYIFTNKYIKPRKLRKNFISNEKV